MASIPEIYCQISVFIWVWVGLDLVPPEGWHEQHIPWFQHTLGSLCLRELRKAFQVWSGNIHRRHHHGSALEELFS